MAKKSSSKIVTAVRAVRAIKPHARAKRPVAVRSNPRGGGGELMQTVMPVLPAVASYIGARLIGRIVRMIIGARIARGAYEKHFGPLGNLAAFGGAYFAGKKVQSAKRYQTELLIGAGIAFFQSVLETYLPGMSHFIDASPQLTAPQPGFGTGANGTKKGLSGYNNRPAKTRYVSPGELESERAIASERVSRAQSQNIDSEAPEVSDEMPDAMGEDSEAVALAEENEQLSDLYDGVFSQ